MGMADGGVRRRRLRLFRSESRCRPCSTSNPNRFISIPMEKSVAESGVDSNVSMDKTVQPSHEPSSCKKRRLCNCDWVSGLPDEILVSILDKMDSKTAVSTSILSRRWRHLWRFLQSFHFSELILPDNYCRVRIEQMVRCSNENRNQHFVESMQWFSRLKRETPLRRLNLMFSGSTECTEVVNSA
ncbi:hypothetical protein ACQ4PT_024820 [Festuca glaucescens]